MRTAEQIFKSKIALLGEHGDEILFRAMYYKAIDAIIEAQKEAYNQALEDAYYYIDENLPKSDFQLHTMSKLKKT